MITPLEIKQHYFRNNRKREMIFRWAGIMFIGIVFPILSFIFEKNETNDFIIEIISYTILGFIIWHGCMFLSYFVYMFYSRTLTKPFVLMVIFTTIFVIIVTFLRIWILDYYFNIEANEDEVFSEILESLLITYLISTIYVAVFFFSKFKQNLIHTEQLERANLEARFESLKTQINPHFLFNSLNTLLTLVTGNKLAEKYVENLSDFMRYLVQNRDKEAVLLKDELIIAKQYVFIQQIRFADKLKVNISILDNYNNFSVAPLSIQILIENAIKHNVISQENPLIISIYSDNEQNIVVSNNIQPKLDAQPSTGIGLQNIQNRYNFLTDKKIIVLKENNTFTVKLPLFKIDL